MRAAARMKPSTRAFTGGRTRVFVRTGLCDADMGRHAALHRFGDGEHVVLARFGELRFGSDRAVFEPLQYPRLVEVMEEFGADGRVPIELETENRFVVFKKLLGACRIERAVRHKSARVGVVARIPRARCTPVGLRGASLVARKRRQKRRAGFVDQSFGTKCLKTGRFVKADRNGRHRIGHDVKYGLAQLRVVQALRTAFEPRACSADDSAFARHIDRRHRKHVRDAQRPIGFAAAASTGFEAIAAAKGAPAASAALRKK